MGFDRDQIKQQLAELAQEGVYLGTSSRKICLLERDVV
jgi:hypothetical protein